MSKNIFHVLTRHDDSDDEGQAKPKPGAKPQAKPNNAPPAKETKKEYRAKDAQLREKYGDVAENRDRPYRENGGPRIKDDYAPGEKRPYERHSGTGRPAHKKNDYKKGGHGKGNVGNDPEKAEDGNVEAETNAEGEVEKKVEVVKEPVEEIVTLDDYISNTGATFGIKGENQVRRKDPKAFEDANTKAIVSKRSQQVDDKKNTKQVVEKKQSNKNVVELNFEDNNQRRNNNRQGYNKQGYVKYDKNEFPSLD